MKFSLSDHTKNAGTTEAEKATFTMKSSSPMSSISVPGMLGGKQGVPLAVPLPFLLTGVIAAALFGFLLPGIVPEALQAAGYPHVLALVHIATLGWLTMAIMGATLQLIPVIITSPLRGTRFIYGLYPLYLLGIVLLISGFWWMLPLLLVIGGSLVVLAVIHYGIVLAVTLTHASKRPLTLRFLVASLIYLCLVVSLGLTAALNFQFGFLGTSLNQLLLTHITLGVIGWLSTTLIGVSYTLVRLFALAHEHDDRVGRWVFILLNTSIIGLAAGFLLAWMLVIVLACILLLISIWLFAFDYRRMLRVRRRKVLDMTQYHGIAAVLALNIVVPLGLAALLFGWQQSSMLTALCLLALVGWIGQSIIGYLYKIVPFLIWQTRYGPYVGRRKVPLMRDMLHQRWSLISFWCINIGVVVASLTAIFGWILPLQIASWLLGGGLALAAVNIVSVLFA
jgi:hypothetical protein